jgi:hypothetical protein
MLKPIKIDYNFDFFLNADYSVHEGSCIAHQVHELTDVHEEYGGFPDSYESKNTKIRQLWFDNTQVDFDILGHQLNMQVITVSTILQPPGNTVPIHRDTFFQINKRYPDDTRLKVRANIYLEDWKVGHFLQYQEADKNWHNSTHWKQGEGWMWDSKHLHLSSNAGMNDKYTLQISGFLN